MTMYTSEEIASHPDYSEVKAAQDALFAADREMHDSDERFADELKRLFGKSACNHRYDSHRKGWSKDAIELSDLRRDAISRWSDLSDAFKAVKQKHGVSLFMCYDNRTYNVIPLEYSLS